MQQTAVHNHTATMIEIGTNLLSQTAEQTRKLTNVEAQVRFYNYLNIRGVKKKCKKVHACYAAERLVKAVQTVGTCLHTCTIAFIAQKHGNENMAQVMQLFFRVMNTLIGLLQMTNCIIVASEG